MIRPITLPLLVLALTGVLAMVSSVGVGSVAISPADVLSVFLGEGSNLQRTLILELRLPRTLSAFATGGLLHGPNPSSKETCDFLLGFPDGGLLRHQIPYS